MGDTVYVIASEGGDRVRCKITKVVEFSGTQTSESAVGVAGNIVGLSGFEDIDIGDTITADENAHALPFTEIDPPTIEMQFCINDGPLAGRDGKYRHFPPAPRPPLPRDEIQHLNQGRGHQTSRAFST